MFSGNCGMFAWAAAKFLSENGLDTSIGLVADGDLSQEPDIFHVWFNVGANGYDASGHIGIEDLEDFMKARYPHAEGHLHPDLPLNEQTRLILSANTDWTTDWPDYYKAFKNAQRSYSMKSKSVVDASRTDLRRTSTDIRSILGEAYEDEAHPSTVEWFRNPDDEHLRDHPVLRQHGHTLAQSAFNHSDEKFKSRNVQMHRLLQVFNEVQRREARHAAQLVQLAKDAVAQVWGVSTDMFGTAELGQADPNDTEEHFEQEQGAKVDDRVKSHIHMRSSLNMLTHGAAVHQMQSLHHLVAEKLNAIDPELMRLYDQLASGTVHHYWFADIRAMAEMLKHAAVGSANVEWPDDDGGDAPTGKPKVVAKGVCFPVLCQELSKGLMMLLSSHHLSSLDKSTATSVLKHADRIDQEPWYIMVGPELWRRFIAAVGNTMSHAHAVAALAKMEPHAAHKLINAVVTDPAHAQRLLKQALPESSAPRISKAAAAMLGKP